MAKSDPHDVLGVPRGASEPEIKRAFRRLALALHPDRNPAPDATERFRAVQAAYEALTSGGGADRDAGDPVINEMPYGFLQDFTDALERAESLLFRVLLPYYLGSLGGAEVAAALADDLAAGRLEAKARQVRGTWRGHRRARALEASIAVHVDYGPAPLRGRVVRRWARSRRLDVVLAPYAFWKGGVRELHDLDVAVAEQLAALVASVIAARAGFSELPSPDRLALARAHDRRAWARWWIERLPWLLVALLSAALLGLAFASRW